LKIVRAMELITILNHCHRHRGFVYHQARFGPDKKSIEVHVRPREGSAAVCSGCQRPAPGYDHLPERCFEFIPLWGFLVFLLYRMRRVDCRSCGVVVEQVPWGDGILDRFHIVAKMNKALDEVRAAESRKMAQEGHPPLLKMHVDDSVPHRIQHQLGDRLKLELAQVIGSVMPAPANSASWSPHSR
jgi:transposase